MKHFPFHIDTNFVAKPRPLPGSRQGLGFAYAWNPTPTEELEPLGLVRPLMAVAFGAAIGLASAFAYHAIVAMTAQLFSRFTGV